MLAEEGQALQLVSVETARHVGFLIVQEYYLLAQKHLLAQDGCQASQVTALSSGIRTFPSTIFGRNLGKKLLLLKQDDEPIGIYFL